MTTTDPNELMIAALRALAERFRAEVLPPLVAFAVALRDALPPEVRNLPSDELAAFVRTACERI